MAGPRFLLVIAPVPRDAIAAEVGKIVPLAARICFVMTDMSAFDEPVAVGIVPAP